MNFYKEHQKLLKEVMISIQKMYPEARAFERHVGVFRYLRSNGIIKINKPGMADLWLIYKGHHFEIEIKTRNAKQTKEQKNWEKTITSCGSYYLVVRSLEDIKKIGEIIGEG